eukprot:CAMPEP_0176448474 /NCGR_PEP_ID=MMETSP0127-20121128/25803_1 /TAXON_ID=938130 /ORGANISM="Platyophrya macrostoma, Strain WH" /LENGTH=254 /DNA_ID=CAMNT_0017835427 /DNA_START=36 /DNA_END=800 /DNA_ORIENTATION=+
MNSSFCIVVLGCTVLPDGSPSDWLTDRLEAAITVVTSIVSSIRPNSTDPIVINMFLTGGAVKSEITEASCMRHWLMTRLSSEHSFEVTKLTDAENCLQHLCVPVKIIFHEEAAAQDTLDNMVFTLRLIFGNEECSKHCFSSTFDSKIILITSDFHLGRSLKLLSQELTHQLNTTEVGKSVVITAVNLSDITADTLKHTLAQYSESTVPMILGIGSPTPTLFGDALVARQKRELMLTTKDTKRQLELRQSTQIKN